MQCHDTLLHLRLLDSWFGRLVITQYVPFTKQDPQNRFTTYRIQDHRNTIYKLGPIEPNPTGPYQGPIGQPIDWSRKWKGTRASSNIRTAAVFLQIYGPKRPHTHKCPTNFVFVLSVGIRMKNPSVSAVFWAPKMRG